MNLTSALGRGEIAENGARGKTYQEYYDDYMNSGKVNRQKLFSRLLSYPTLAVTGAVIGSTNAPRDRFGRVTDEKKHNVYTGTGMAAGVLAAALFNRYLSDPLIEDRNQADAFRYAGMRSGDYRDTGK